MLNLFLECLISLEDLGKPGSFFVMAFLKKVHHATIETMSIWLIVLDDFEVL